MGYDPVKPITVMASKSHNERCLDDVLCILITASHICHHYGILDADGHISVRNPDNPATFFLSRDLAPALISNSDDLVEYQVDNAEPVNPNAKAGCSERCIHSELFKKFAHVHSVIHSHAADVLPFCISHVPLRPSTSTAGFLGNSHIQYLSFPGRPANKGLQC